MSDLVELADRVSALGGPDREVDFEIEKLVRPRAYMLDGPARQDPAYTASLDAAMTLVPDGWEWQMEAEETEMFFPPSPWTYRVEMGNLIKVEAATPALALTAAALRARATLQETDDE